MTGAPDDHQARPRRDDLGVVHEINVTPFIDVIMVLLIILRQVTPVTTVANVSATTAGVETPQPPSRSSGRAAYTP